MARLKKYLFLLFLPFVARANDCVPLSLERLSIYYHHPISYYIWYNEIMPDGEPPDVSTVIRVWNKLEPEHILTCTWIAKGLQTPLLVIDLPLELHRAYLWIGIEPRENLANLKEEANCHSCLLFFESDYVILLSPLKPHNKNSTEILIQTWTYKEFLARTLCVFKVNDNITILR